MDLTGFIRTYVPIVVGYLLTQFIELTGLVDIDTEQVALTVTGIVIAVYYATVRWAETRWPNAGWLLGKASPPVYDT